MDIMNVIANSFMVILAYAIVVNFRSQRFNIREWSVVDGSWYSCQPGLKFSFDFLNTSTRRRNIHTKIMLVLILHSNWKGPTKIHLPYLALLNSKKDYHHNTTLFIYNILMLFTKDCVLVLFEILFMEKLFKTATQL